MVDMSATSVRRVFWVSAALMFLVGASLAEAQAKPKVSVDISADLQCVGTPDQFVAGCVYPNKNKKTGKECLTNKPCKSTEVPVGGKCATPVDAKTVTGLKINGNCVGEVPKTKPPVGPGTKGLPQLLQPPGGGGGGAQQGGLSKVEMLDRIDEIDGKLDNIKTIEEFKALTAERDALTAKIDELAKEPVADKPKSVLGQAFEKLFGGAKDPVSLGAKEPDPDGGRAIAKVQPQAPATGHTFASPADPANPDSPDSGDSPPGSQGPVVEDNGTRYGTTCYGTWECGDNPNLKAHKVDSRDKPLNPSQDRVVAVGKESPYKYGQKLLLRRELPDGTVLETVARVSDHCPGCENRTLDLTGATARDLGGEGVNPRVMAFRVSADTPLGPVSSHENGGRDYQESITTSPAAFTTPDEHMSQFEPSPTKPSWWQRNAPPWLGGSAPEPDPFPENATDLVRGPATPVIPAPAAVTHGQQVPAPEPAGVGSGTPVPVPPAETTPTSGLANPIGPDSPDSTGTRASPSGFSCGLSIADCLGGRGDYASRKKLAEQLNIQGYRGTAEQNTQMIKILNARGLPIPTPIPRSLDNPYVMAATRYPTGASIVDFLIAGGLPSDRANRAALARENNISNYTGTGPQNIRLLRILRAKGLPR